MAKALVLIEVDQTPGGIGLPDIRKEIAISNDYLILSDYCEKIIGKPIGKPRVFSWDNYYEIEETNKIIL